MENEIENSFKISPPSKEITRSLNWAKQVQHLCTENHKTSLRETKEEFISRDLYRVHEVENSVSLRCQFYPNWAINLK